MNQILVTRPHEQNTGKKILWSMYRFRKSVFKNRLGWAVECHKDQERDRFDDLKPVYLLARTRKGKIQGCFRLLSTTGPYMLKDVFPEMLGDHEAPNASDIWELSRFAVLPSAKNSRTHANFCPITLEMLRGVYEFAAENGISRYIFVTSVGIERLLRRIKLPISRFGDGRVVRLGKVPSVVLWVDINKQCRDALYSDTFDGHQALAA